MTFKIPKNIKGVFKHVIKIFIISITSTVMNVATLGLLISLSSTRGKETREFYILRRPDKFLHILAPNIWIMGTNFFVISQPFKTNVCIFVVKIHTFILKKIKINKQSLLLVKKFKMLAPIYAKIYIWPLKSWIFLVS